MKPFAPSSANGNGSDPVTLVVGDMARWSSRDRELPVMAGLSFVDVRDLDAALLATHSPDIIMSPLVVRDTDAVEIARTLSQLKFQGRYRVVADDIPDADVIQGEVSAAAPKIDFAIISLPTDLFGT